MNRAVRTSVLILLVLGAIGTYAAGAHRRAHMLSPDEMQEIPTLLDSIPLSPPGGAFRGHREPLSDEDVQASGADYATRILYRGQDGGPVRLHVGAAARTDAWFHEPTVCLPNQGWQTTSSTRVPLWDGLSGAGSGASIGRLTLTRRGEGLLVYYWLQYGREIVASKGARRWVRLHDLLEGQRDRPAQITMFYTPIDADIGRSETRVEALARDLWPSIHPLFSTGDDQ